MNRSNHMETQLNSTQLNSTRLNSTEMNTYLNAALNMIESNSYPVTKSIESWGRWIDSTTGTSDEIQRPTLWQPLHREPETAPKKKYKNSPTKEPLRVFSSRAARGHLPCIFFPFSKASTSFLLCVYLCVCVCNAAIFLVSLLIFYFEFLPRWHIDTAGGPLRRLSTL